MQKSEYFKYISDKYNTSNVDIFNSSEDCIYHVLAHVLKCKISDIKLMENIDLTLEEEKNTDEIFDLLCNAKKPFQYIVGSVNIYNETYLVTPSCLIPRYDTECLIDEAIKRINTLHLQTMLDLCTGSGVIAISIAKNSTIKNVIMSDISKDAISIANKNIKLNKVEDKCKTFVSDLFSNIPNNNDNKFDIITANPPYISNKDYKLLSPFVKKEPKLALVADNDGLYFYIKIAREAKEFLNNNGILIFEIGYNQKNEVTEILKNEGYKEIEVVKDLNLNDRVVICRFQNK